MTFDHIAAFVIGAGALYAVAKGVFLLTLPPLPITEWRDEPDPDPQARELIDG